MSDRLKTHPNAKQRMEGPLHHFEIAREARELQAEEAYGRGERNGITLIHEGPLRVALFTFHKGDCLTDHLVAGPISVNVLSGRIVFSTQDSRKTEMPQGSLLSLAECIPHNIEALEDSVVILNFVQAGEPAKQNGA